MNSLLGISWNDTGEGRPRNWLTLDRIAVYDEAKVGILPMGVLLSRVGAARADNPPTAEGLAE
jgi:hypothetical protein